MCVARSLYGNDADVDPIDWATPRSHSADQFQVPIGFAITLVTDIVTGALVAEPDR